MTKNAQVTFKYKLQASSLHQYSILIDWHLSGEDLEASEQWTYVYPA
jgi:hypothetical protein